MEAAKTHVSAILTKMIFGGKILKKMALREVG
jgi:hypothetical protein